MIPNKIKATLNKLADLSKEEAVNELIRYCRVGKMRAEKYYDEWKENYVEEKSIQAAASKFRVVKIMLETTNGVFSVSEDGYKTLKKKAKAHEEKLQCDELDLELVRKYLVEIGAFGG